MSSPHKENAEALFRQIISMSEDLAEHLSAKNWNKAVAIDRERLNLLTRLGEIRQSISSDEYTTFLHQALSFIQIKQSEVQGELDNCRAKMGELGQQRRASSLYKDTSLAR